MIVTTLASIKDELLHLMVHISSAHTCRNGEVCGLPHIKFHGLRHSATTLLMYLSGSDAKTVQTITGHGSAKFVFDVYNHPLMSNQKNLVDKLEQVMYNTDPQPEQQSLPGSLSLEDIMRAMKKGPLLAKKVFSALDTGVALTVAV